jgi:hypothetical protein
MGSAMEGAWGPQQMQHGVRNGGSMGSAKKKRGKHGVLLGPAIAIEGALGGLGPQWREPQLREHGGQ